MSTSETAPAHGANSTTGTAVAASSTTGPEASASSTTGPEAAASTAATDSPLEQAYAALVAAINAQPPGGEARYLARLALLLLSELHFSDAALRLIDRAHEKPDERSQKV